MISFARVLGLHITADGMFNDVGTWFVFRTAQMLYAYART